MVEASLTTKAPFLCFFMRVRVYLAYARYDAAPRFSLMRFAHFGQYARRFISDGVRDGALCVFTPCKVRTYSKIRVFTPCKVKIDSRLYVFTPCNRKIDSRLYVFTPCKVKTDSRFFVFTPCNRKSDSKMFVFTPCKQGACSKKRDVTSCKHGKRRVFTVKCRCRTRFLHEDLVSMGLA